MLQKSILFLIFSGFSAISFFAQAKPKPTPTPEPAQTYYYQLTAKEISDLEGKLKTDPTGIEAREKLINYYKERETPANKKIVQRHRLAMIENNPQNASVLHLGAWFQDEFEKPEYIELKNAWLKQISLNKKDKNIRFQAASFVEYELPLAEKILKEGQTLDPNDYEYSLKLIELYDSPFTGDYNDTEEIRYNNRIATLKKIVAEAQNALGLLRKAENSDVTSLEIRKMLAISAKYALETGNLELAKKSADELIVKSGDPKMLAGSIFEPDVDNFQIANSVLGRIALRAGNLEKAREYLFNSLLMIDDEKNTYPKIDAPFLEEMLVRNGSKNVIEYLQLFVKSKHFEESDKQGVREIITKLNRGKVPNFEGLVSIY